MSEPDDEEESLQLQITTIDDGPTDPEGFRPILVGTSRGAIALRHYAADDPSSGVLWLGGVGGGWDTPAGGLYPKLAAELLDQGISSCRVRFRVPASLPESILDALVAVRFLIETGCPRIAVVGHSQGGAIALQAAANLPEVVTVVALSTQTYGATVAENLPRTTSVLLVHGTADDLLPPSCSRTIHGLVPGKKRLLLLDGATHVLDEAADEVTNTVRQWLVSELSGDSNAS